MRFPRPGLMLRKDFLTAVRTVSISSSVGVSTHVAIGVPNVVSVFFVEDVVSDFTECPAPEDKAFFER